MATSTVSAPAAGLLELRGDVAPGRPLPVFRRQVSHELAHVGQRLERHDRGDDQGPRKGPRPVRTLTQHGCDAPRFAACGPRPCGFRLDGLTQG